MTIKTLLPAIPSVNRNETNDTSNLDLIPKRCSQRNLSLTVISGGKSKEGETLTNRTPKKTEKLGWIVEEFKHLENGCISLHNTDEGEDIKSIAVKRGKRALNSEKLGPRSVKILRRSQAQCSTDIAGKKPPKIHLPLVKNTKAA